jgi:hypothetical protein
VIEIGDFNQDFLSKLLGITECKDEERDLIAVANF